MALTLSQHVAVLKDCYDVSELSSIWIDGNEITGYFTYTFVNSKTLNKTPRRSKGGQIKNINNYSFFITPRVKIFFNYLSLKEYQTIMRLIQSKNEFVVRLFDIEKGEMVTHKMYFSTEDYPELAFGYGKLRGIKGYSIELQGTNNGLDSIQVIYHLNPPSDTGVSDIVAGTTDFESGADIVIGADAKTSSSNKFQDYTFGNNYKFSKWSVAPQPIASQNTGFKYLDGKTYTINGNTSLILYATWTAGG